MPMKNLQTSIRKHKKLLCVIGLVFIVCLECCVFPKARWLLIVRLNFGITIMGMAVRYLLEYGEVSNTYNFTPKNIVVHIVIMLLLSMMFWMQTKGKGTTNI